MKKSQRSSHSSPAFAPGPAASAGLGTARDRRSAVRLHALVLGLGALVVPSLNAASDSWDGSTDSLWATATNWSTDTSAPGTGEIATFNGAGNGNTTIDLGVGVTVGSVIFDTASAAAYTIGAGGAGAQTLSFDNAGALTINSGVTTSQLVDANVQLNSAAAATSTFTNNGTGLLSIAGTVNANVASGNGVLNVTGSGNTTISGAVTKTGLGSNALLKTGAGTLTLSNGSAWTGAGAIGYVPPTSVGFPVVVREGTLRLAGGTHSVTGELVIGGVVANGGAGQNAAIQVDSGALNISSWLSIGRGNGNGTATSDLTLNNAATVTAGNLSAGYNANNTGNLPKGTITLNNTASLSVNAGDTSFFLGESAGSNFTLTLNDSSSVTLNGSATGGDSARQRSIGHQGTGTLNINGSATFNDVGTSALNVGYQNGTGVVNLNSGTFSHANGEVRVGGSDQSAVHTGSGTINISGGTATLGALTLARGNSNTSLINGTVNLSGGTLTVVNDVIVGYAGNGNVGQLNITGGTMNVGTSATKWMRVGQWDTTRGEVTISSGALNLNTNTAIKMNAEGTVGANVITQNGGAVTFYSDNATTVGGTGHLDMQRSGAAASNNTYHLNGGTLTVPQVLSTAVTGTRTFNFNGGTLRAIGSTSSFFNLGTGNARANVRNGGALIDTNSFSVTVAQALLHSNIGGDNATDGGLIKSGLGTLTLSGASTYTGATAVSAGTLALGAAGTLASTSYTIANGAEFDVSAKAAYALSGVTASIGLDASTGGFFDAGAAALDFTNGNLSLGFSTASLTDGQTYNLFDFGSQTGDLASVGLSGSFGGSLSRTGEIWSGTSGSWGFSFNETDGILTVTAVPEPSTFAALAGLLGLGFAACRRRRS